MVRLRSACGSLWLKALPGFQKVNMQFRFVFSSLVISLTFICINPRQFGPIQVFRIWLTRSGLLISAKIYKDQVSNSHFHIQSLHPNCFFFFCV